MFRKKRKTFGNTLFQQNYHSLLFENRQKLQKAMLLQLRVDLIEVLGTIYVLKLEKRSK